MAPPTVLVTTPPVVHPVNHKGVKHLLDSGISTLPPAYIAPKDDTILTQPNPTSFPIIDISALDNPTGRAAVVNAIISACTNGGYFLVTNHGLKQSTMDDLLKAVETFFDLPLDEKMKYASDHDMAPVRYGSSLNTNEPQPHHFWRDYLRHFGRPVIAESCHLWPSTPSNYTELAKEFLETSWDIAMKLAEALSEGMGKENNYIEGTLGEGLQTISCNYYPPCPQPELALGVGAHTDQGGISILIDNHVDGLQMKHEGKWFPVPHVPGALVVNLGDYLEEVSAGKYKAAEHRVMVNDLKGRISVAVGNGPELKHYGMCPPTILRFV
ncbi:2OG-Fe(II) oxygenase family protein [Enterococcus faecium]